MLEIQEKIIITGLAIAMGILIYILFCKITLDSLDKRDKAYKAALRPYHEIDEKVFNQLIERQFKVTKQELAELIYFECKKIEQDSSVKRRYFKNIMKEYSIFVR